MAMAGWLVSCGSPGVEGGGPAANDITTEEVRASGAGGCGMTLRRVEGSGSGQFVFFHGIAADSGRMRLDGLMLRLEVPPEAREWKQIVLLAAVGGQCATVAGWLALGDGPVPVRLMFVLHAVGFAELLKPSPATPLGPWPVVVAVFIGTWAAPLALLRHFGWSCRRVDEEDRREIPRRFQFRIGHILVLMTVLAVALAVLRIAPAKRKP